MSSKIAQVSLLVLVLTIVAIIAPTHGNVPSGCNCIITRDNTIINATLATSCMDIQCETVRVCKKNTSLLGILLGLVLNLVNAVVDLTVALLDLPNICASIFVSVTLTDLTVIKACSNPNYFIYQVPRSCNLLGCTSSPYCLGLPSYRCPGCTPTFPQPCTTVGIPNNNFVFGTCGSFFAVGSNNRVYVQQIIVQVFVKYTVTVGGVTTCDYNAVVKEIKAILEIEIKIKFDVIIGLNPNRCSISYQRSDCYCVGRYTPLNLDVIVYGVLD